MMYDTTPAFNNSGDPAVESFEGTHLVYVGAGSDPFEVITNAVKYANIFHN
jgi:hypothetical protein